MEIEATGRLRKMKTSYSGVASYWLRLDQQPVAHLNELIHKEIVLEWTGRIFCVNCGKSIRKTYGEGFCFDCFGRAAEASPCIIRPELCEAHLGKGRDVQWELDNHNQPHAVYLAQTGGVKVGITKESNIPARWIDQGAWKAVVLARVPYRKLAGDIEVELKQYITDRTDWRKMLTDLRSDEDLSALASELKSFLPESLASFAVAEQEVMELKYPVAQYPGKVSTVVLEEMGKIESQLHGLRGQYMYFSEGKVINIRKYTGYEVRFAART